MRNTKKTYYVCHIFDGNKFIISTSMQYIADCLMISQKTLSRRLAKSDVYSTDSFVVRKNVEINKIRTGFALRS